MNHIEQQLLDYFREQNPLDADDINLDTRFRDDLDYNSLDLVDMRAQMIIVFGIHIEIEHLAEMKRIRDLAQYVQQIKIQ